MVGIQLHSGQSFILGSAGECWALWNTFDLFADSVWIFPKFCLTLTFSWIKIAKQTGKHFFHKIMCSFTKISDSWWCVQRGAVIRNVLWSCLFTRVTQFRNQRETGRVAETETGFTLLHVSAPWKWIWSCYFRVKQLHNLALNPFLSYPWVHSSSPKFLSPFIHSNSIFSLPPHTPSHTHTWNVSGYNRGTKVCYGDKL